MSETKKIHIQGEIAETPSTDSKDSYSRYVFSVHSNGKYPVKVVAWGYKDFPARYRIGDKVIISGSRVTIKTEENGKMRCYPVVRAETIILEH
ncbi:MAG: hypothetical protein ACI4I1_01315 [Oscillospiraceae bacterium]